MLRLTIGSSWPFSVLIREEEESLRSADSYRFCELVQLQKMRQKIPDMNYVLRAFCWNLPTYPPGANRA